MSAFILNNETIAYIVSAAKKYGCLGSRSEQEAGQLLVNANYASVNDRYDDKETPHHFECMRFQGINPVTAYQQCRCLNYQSCECDDWEDSEAFQLLEAIQAACLQRAPQLKNQLDGQPWGLFSHDVIRTAKTLITAEGMIDVYTLKGAEA